MIAISTWSARVVLEAVAAVLSPAPDRIRLITAGGQYFTLNSFGGALTALGPSDGAAPWDWDSKSIPVPPDAGNMRRMWFIVFPPAGMSVDDYSVDRDAVRKALAEVLLEGWAAPWLILAGDPSSFDPMRPESLADGFWSWSGKTVERDGELFHVAARNPAHRYIPLSAD